MVTRLIGEYVIVLSGIQLYSRCHCVLGLEGGKVKSWFVGWDDVWEG
jgi:hypothetical protein